MSHNTTARMTSERLAEIKKIAACVPFLDDRCDDGLVETMNAFQTLLSELAAVTRELEEANRVLAMYRIARSRQTLSDNTKMENQ